MVPGSTTTVVAHRDYIVDFISDDRVIAAALQWRQQGVGDLMTFDVTKFIDEFLRKHSARPFRLSLTDHVNAGELAFVTYDPNPVMNVDKELWSDAKLGEPRGRFILAHECAHVIFHSNDAKAFSNTDERHIKSALDQNRPEHHANLFADHFLVPDDVVKRLRTAQEIAKCCDVEASVAERRVENYGKKYLSALIKTGEYCPNCCEMLYRRGVRTFCKSKTCMFEAVI